MGTERKASVSAAPCRFSASGGGSWRILDSIIRQRKFSASIRSDPVAVILVYASQWSSGEREIP